MGLFSFLTQDIAVDLGTANTIIICNDKMVVNEPSIVAIDRKTEKVIAIGEKARQMQGKTHDNIKTIRPLRDGVIADFNAAEQMLRGMIKMASVNSKFFSPSLRIVVVSRREVRKLKSGLSATLQNMQEEEMYI